MDNPEELRRDEVYRNLYGPNWQQDLEERDNFELEDESE